MRILLVVKNMRLSNGVASYAMNYYRALNGSDVQFDFLIVSDVGSPYYLEIEKNKSKVFLMPPYKKKPFKVVSYLNRLFKDNNYDVLHCNVMNSGSIILKIAKYHKIPVRILHSHATQSGDKKWKEIRNKLFCKVSLKNANAYFACSHLAGDYLFGKNNYWLIPNAIDIDKYLYDQQKRNRLRDEENCKNKLVITTVGRFTYQKNPMFIVDVVYELSKMGLEFIFWWFGNGELETEVHKYASVRGVNKLIKFWGANPRVMDYYSAADIFVLPSFYEGLPVVGIEAQVAALPVLFSDTITIETQISNFVKFLPITEAKLWAENIVELQECNRETIMKSLKLSEYRIENQAEKLKNLYSKLLKKYR